MTVVPTVAWLNWTWFLSLNRSEQTGLVWKVVLGLPKAASVKTSFFELDVRPYKRSAWSCGWNGGGTSMVCVQPCFGVISSY